MIELGHILSVEGRTNSGMTRPLLAQCETSSGDVVLTVLKTSQTSPFRLVSIVRETIAAQLANSLGVSMPRWHLVEIPPNMADYVPADCRADFCSCVPVAFATEYVPGSSTLRQGGFTDGRHADAAVAIFLFDHLINNGDRRASNTNLLLSDNGLWAIDHELCFTELLIGARKPWNGGMENNAHDDHPLRVFLQGNPAADIAGACDRWRNLSEPQIDSYVEQLPMAWAAEHGAAVRAITMIRDSRNHIDEIEVELRRILA